MLIIETETRCPNPPSNLHAALWHLILTNAKVDFCSCSPGSSAPRTSCSTNVAITAVVSCAVSFITGALVGAVVHYCTVRKKCDCQKLYSDSSSQAAATASTSV